MMKKLAHRTKPKAHLTYHSIGSYSTWLIAWSLLANLAMTHHAGHSLQLDLTALSTVTDTGKASTFLLSCLIDKNKNHSYRVC